MPFEFAATLLLDQVRFQPSAVARLPAIVVNERRLQTEELCSEGDSWVRWRPYWKIAGGRAPYGTPETGRARTTPEAVGENREDGVTRRSMYLFVG
jgi:hypothetical protein